MLLKVIKSSFFYNLILRAVSFLKSLLKSSFIYDFVMKPSCLGEKCENSFFYKYKEKVISALREKCRSSMALKVVKSSYAGKFLKIELVAPVLFLIMLITPHDYWNNLYGTLIAAVLFIMLIFSKDGYSFKRVSLYTVIFLISAFGGLFITPSFYDGVRMLLFTVVALIFMRAIESGMKTEKALTRLMWFLAVSLCFMSIYAIVQNFKGVEVDELLTDVVNNKGMPGRVYSTVANPNNFAEIIVLLTPLSFSLFLQSKNYRLKFASLFIIAVSLVALILTYSRGCYISFAISLVVFIALYNWKYLMPLALLGIMCVPLLPQSVLNRILTLGSLSDTSSAYRVYLWDGVFRMLKDNIICGVGLGSEAFRQAYVPYAHRFAEGPAHSHMLYTQIFIELGLIGGTSFFALWFSSIKKGLATYNGADKKIKTTIIASVSAFAGIMFSAATEYIWFYPRVMFVFFIVLGILLCAVKLKTEKSA